MPNGARIVVTTFESPSSPKIVPWREHSSRVAGVLLGEESGRPVAPASWAAGALSRPAVWHLASSNHRMLARSVGVFESALQAVEDATAALADQAALETALVRDRAGAALGWLLRIEERPIVSCARWYATDRDRRKSLAAAVEAIATAEIAPLVRISHPHLGIPVRG
jgi:hypothetical protein